jgi:hypothetical protein
MQQLGGLVDAPTEAESFEFSQEQGSRASDALLQAIFEFGGKEKVRRRCAH